MSPIKVSKVGKPIWRESEREYAGRAIVVGLEPLSICFRLAGCRQVVRLPIGLAYERACQLEANHVKPKRVRRTFRRGALAFQ